MAPRLVLLELATVVAVGCGPKADPVTAMAPSPAAAWEDSRFKGLETVRVEGRVETKSGDVLHGATAYIASPPEENGLDPWAVESFFVTTSGTFSFRVPVGWEVGATAAEHAKASKVVTAGGFVRLVLHPLGTVRGSFVLTEEEAQHWRIARASGMSPSMRVRWGPSEKDVRWLDLAHDGTRALFELRLPPGPLTLRYELGAKRHCEAIVVRSEGTIELPPVVITAKDASCQDGHSDGVP